ncbi:MAG: hypothetical protein AB1598_12225 [Thermodesulfobacteriota bacterium]
MYAKNIPFASHEVRWFFDGAVDKNPALGSWFETSSPIPKQGGFGPPVWMGRLGGEPDVYLLVPGADDMGIKWREGNFQVKGRTASLGVHSFCGRFQGSVERWVRWSYAGMPEAYRNLFLDGNEKGLITVSVRKTRALRKIKIDTYDGSALEVDPKEFIDRGINFELTDIEVGGKPYCTVAFEAYPDDSAMHAAFTRVVEAFLGGLKGVELGAGNSMSYPEWLLNIVSGAGNSG